MQKRGKTKKPQWKWKRQDRGTLRLVCFIHSFTLLLPFIKFPRQLYTPSVLNCNWCDIHVVKSLTAAGNSQSCHNPILLTTPHWQVNLSHHHPLAMTHCLLHFPPIFIAGTMFCFSKLLKQACVSKRFPSWYLGGTAWDNLVYMENNLMPEIAMGTAMRHPR